LEEISILPICSRIDAFHYMSREVRLYAAVVGLSRWAMIGFPWLWYEGTCNKALWLKGWSSVMMVNKAAISIYERGVPSDCKRLPLKCSASRQDDGTKSLGSSQATDVLQVDQADLDASFSTSHHHLSHHHGLRVISVAGLQRPASGFLPATSMRTILLQV
jgi:hypothetical protein